MKSVEALSLSLYGSDKSDTVIQSLAAEVYKVTVVTSCQSLSTEYKNIISEITLSIHSAIVSISKEINYVQSQILRTTGKEINLSSLDIYVISEVTGEVVLSLGSAEEQESNKVN